jgi:hypothetical protein
MSKMLKQTRKNKKLPNAELQVLWTGPPLGPLEKLSLASFIAYGHPVILYTYNPIDEIKKQIPPSIKYGIKVVDGNTILNRDKQFKFAGRNKAYEFLPFSDLFRFTMLHKKGGRWIDLDMTLIKPLPKKLIAMKYAFSSERTIQKGAYKQKTPEIPDIGYVQVPGPGSELTTWMMDNIPDTTTLKTPFDFMNLYRKALVELKLENYVLPAKAFLPLNWWDIKEAFEEEQKCFPSKYGQKAFCKSDLIPKDVYAIHWFRAILRKRKSPFETAEYEPDSLWGVVLKEIEKRTNMTNSDVF